MRSATGLFDEEEISDLVARYAVSRDVGARNRIVEQLTPLVDGLARRFSGYAEPLDDLVSEGFIGLIRALENYEADRGVKFSTYASHFIVGQIKHYLRDHGKIIREPAWLQEVSHRISAAVERLQQELGRQPTSEEIGERVNLTADSVEEILANRQVFQVLPIDTGESDDDDSFAGIDPDKIRGQHYVSLCLPIEDRIVLERLMARLRDMERSAIHLFFYQDLSQTEIARKLNISCNYAGHLIRTGLQKMRRYIQSEELREAHLTANRPGERRPVIVDRITSLYSDSYFHIRLDEEISRARYYRRNMGLAIVSLDLPRSLSLAARDELLAECGVAIRECLRRADIPARTAESEFSAILPHTSYQSLVVAERLATLLARVTVSRAEWGAAVWPEHGASAPELWHAARSTMLDHKIAASLALPPGTELASLPPAADNRERMTGQLAGERRGRGRPRTRKP